MVRVWFRLWLRLWFGIEYIDHKIRITNFVHQKLSSELIGSYDSLDKVNGKLLSVVRINSNNFIMYTVAKKLNMGKTELIDIFL